MLDKLFGGGSDKRVTEARRAARKGDHDRSGDLYYMAERYEDAINAYLKAGRYKKAASIYEKIGRQREAAECYLKGKDHQSAASLLVNMGDAARAIQLYETHGEFVKAAHLSESMKRFSKAASLYVRAGYFEKASIMYAHNGEFKRAAEALAKSLAPGKSRDGGNGPQKTDLDLLRKLGLIGQYFEKAGMYLEAAKVYDRAKQFLKAAQNYERTGNFVSAIKMYSRVGETSSIERLFHKISIKDLDPRLASEVLMALGRWEEAAALLNAKGDFTRAAGCFERAGDRRGAATAYEKAGENGTAGELWLSLGEYERASELLVKARMYDLAASAFRRSGKHKEAAEYYLSAGDGIKSAEIFLEIGAFDRSIDVLQRMDAQAAPASQIALLLGDNFRAKGLFTLAADKYRETIGDERVHMGNLRAFYGLALCYEQMNQLEQARSCLEKVVSIDYGFADASDRLESLLQRSTPASTPVPTGNTTLIKNRYEITEKLSREGDTDLLNCWDREMERSIQIERIPFDKGDPASVRRLVEDARTASRLVHTNIVMVYDVFEDGSGAYICSEHFKGKTLRDIIEQGGLPVAKLSPVATQLTEALSYAHSEGVLHRNLCPENIALTDSGMVKLSGFSHERGIEELRRTPRGLKALQYAPPELFRGMPLDKRSDIFSLGACLYELSASRAPFPVEATSGGPPMQPPEHIGMIRSDLPRNIQNVLMKCLEVDPDNRYLDTKQILEDLKTIEIVPGVVVSDRYELIKEIGSGGMGKIFQALDRELEEVIVLKLLRSEFGLDPVIEQRFVREIKLTRKVIHQGIVNVFDIGKWNGMRYITMEYIEGVNLERYVEEQGHADLATTIDFSIQIASALVTAHKAGVVHRDIKPQNILITKAKKTKIVDFGIARMRAASELTSTGQLIGSPKYMSPEQIRGEMLDHRTDIYSLGVVMYFIFTGREPITGDTPNTILLKQIYESPVPPCQVNPELPPWVELIITKAMAKDINLRYQEMSEIVADSNRFVQEGRDG